MGCGLQRDAIGDILVRALDCDIIALDSLERFICENLTQVGSVRVSLSVISAGQIEEPEKKVRVIRDTVASLRFDAVASTGFGLSREKARDLIRTGRAVLNDRPCDKPERTVAEGDVVSARGLGKFRITSAGSLSKKGRIRIEVEKYE